MTDLLNALEKPLLDKVLSKSDVVEYVLGNGKDIEIISLLEGLLKG
jgi:hypothetical protein